MRFTTIPDPDGGANVLDTWTAESTWFRLPETAEEVALELNEDADERENYPWTYVREARA